MKVLAISALLVLAASSVDAHGGLIQPAPRALRTMGLDIENTFGWPIKMRARATKGKGGDCLGFTQDKKLQALATGKSKIKMRANDGANHIGPCTAYLVDPRDKTKKIKVGEVKDCLRSLHPGPGSKGDEPIPAEMAINVPSDASKLPCDDDGHCVLEWYLEATHITPHEFYNNCADVKINASGGKDDVDGDSDPAQVPAATKKPQPATTPKPSAEPKAVATPKPSSEPKAAATPKPTSERKEVATPKPTSAPVTTKTPSPAKGDTDSSVEKKCKAV